MNKKNVIFLTIGILIFMLMVAVLILLVYKNSELSKNTNNTSVDNSTQNTSNEVGTISERNPEGIANLDITYKNNGLEFKSEKDNIEFEQTDGEPRICMSKYEITGLKNKEIQNKINSEIQSIIDLYRNNNCAITVRANANFSNVLSIEMYATSLDENNDGYRQIGLNYRLDNGEKLQFKDLFENEKDAKEALKKSLEKKLETYNDQQEVYQKIKNVNEQEIANFNNKQYEFSFSADSIDIYNIGNNEADIIINTASIPLVDFADKVTIFTKYLTKESLYEKENNSSEIRAFMPINEYGKLKKIDDETYVIQYFVGDVSIVDSLNVEKIQNQADYEANKIKNQNSGHKVLIQNIAETVINNKSYSEVNTSLFVLKPEYFDSNDFKLDVANGGIVEGMYMIDFNSDYIIYDNMYASRIEL